MSRLRRAARSIGITPLVCGAALVAVLIAGPVRFAHIAAGAVERQRRAHQQWQGIAQDGVPSAEALERARERALRAEAVLKSARTATQIGSYDGGDPIQAFQRALAREEERLRGRIVLGNRRWPERFGLEDPRDEEGAREELVRLAVIVRALDTILEAGIDRVDELDPYDGAGRTVWGRTGGEEAGPFRVTRVQLRFRAPAERVFRAVHAWSQPGSGSFLAVASFEAQSARGGRNELEVDVVVAGIVWEPEE
jgi:hypothetical protein